MNVIGRIACLLLFLFPVSFVHAVRKITIQSDTTHLSGEQSAQVYASMSGMIDGEKLRIKGAFFSPGSTNYFGYTKSSDVWVKNGASTSDQREVEIGKWDGYAEVKSDFSDSGYSGEGDYLLKLGFYYYTQSGTLSSVQWSENSIPFVINAPDPSATPVPTLAPTVTRTPTYVPEPTVEGTASVRAPSVFVPSMALSFGILGASTTATATGEAQMPETSFSPLAVGTGKLTPGMAALLIIGSVGCLSAVAVSLQRTDIWKKQSREIGHT